MEILAEVKGALLEIPEWWRRSKAGKEAAAAEAQHLENERRRLVAAFKDLRARADKELPPLREDRDQALAELEKSFKRWQEDSLIARQAEARYQAAGRQHDAQASELAAKLAALKTPGPLAQFEALVETEISRLVKLSPTVITVDEYFNPPSGKQVRVVETDVLRIKARLMALYAWRREKLPGLRLQALEMEPAALEALLKKTWNQFPKE